MSRRTYHVFLSFRGSDTRMTFIDQLYSALVDKGVHTFKDDDGIERGEDIMAELKRAIKESKISIIVFSINYASSRWCLDELVMIMKQRRAGRHVVLPVFYGVDPSQVRNQTRSYAIAFHSHEIYFAWDMQRVEEWRAALREVANLGGITSSNRHELKVIQDTVRAVQIILHRLARNNTGRAIIASIGNSRTSQGQQNEKVHGLENYAVGKAKETTECINNCLRIAEKTVEVGTETLATLRLQDEQTTRTHNMVTDMDMDLSQVAGKSRNLRKPRKVAGKSRNLRKPRKTQEISGPLGPSITSGNSYKKSESNSEKREKLDLASKGQSATKAFQEVEAEKAKQDDGLSLLSNFLDVLGDLAIDMGTKLDMQNAGVDHLIDDVDELNSKVGYGNKLLRRRLTKQKNKPSTS